jgi:membrane fusion protein, multidrug efflux system
VKTLQNFVTVPTAAIQRGSPGTYVYALGDDGTVSVRQIKIGPTDGTMTAVESGLKAGDRVVVDGSDRLRDGIKVNITEMDGKPVATKAGGGQAGQNGNSGRRRSGGANGGNSGGANSGGQ